MVETPEHSQVESTTWPLVGTTCPVGTEYTISICEVCPIIAHSQNGGFVTFLNCGNSKEGEDSEGGGNSEEERNSELGDYREEGVNNEEGGDNEEGGNSEEAGNSEEGDDNRRWEQCRRW